MGTVGHGGIYTIAMRPENQPHWMWEVLSVSPLDHKEKQLCSLCSLHRKTFSSGKLGSHVRNFCYKKPPERYEQCAKEDSTMQLRCLILLPQEEELVLLSHNAHSSKCFREVDNNVQKQQAVPALRHGPERENP